MWNWAAFNADFMVGLAGWAPTTGAGAALHFFVYDLQKILVLIAAVSFVMALVRGALPLARIRARLDQPGGQMLGYPAAALFGALTPFCSCSSAPVFLGFVQARFPIGVAFAFLIASPLVNEIAVALLAATFGWKIALTYAAAGIALGITGGLVLTALRAERWVDEGRHGTARDGRWSCSRWSWRAVARCRRDEWIHSAQDHAVVAHRPRSWVRDARLRAGGILRTAFC